MSRPLSSILPRVGANRPEIRLNSVDLPAPLGPMIAWRSPTGISRSTPRMISVLPKLLCTPLSLSAGAFIVVYSRTSRAICSSISTCTSLHAFAKRRRIASNASAPPARMPSATTQTSSDSASSLNP